MAETENKQPAEQPQESAESSSGALEWIRSRTPEVITNNAPRIVASMKLISSATMMFSKNKIFAIAGAGFITAFGTIAIFGKKKTEEEKEKLREQDAARETSGTAKKGFFADYTKKLLHPKEYPVESGTSIAMMSSALWTASGLFGKDGGSRTRLIGGALSLASDANVVLTKERIGEPKVNPYQKGTLKHFLKELRNRPVLASSLLNVGCDVTHIVGGAYEWRKKGKEMNAFIVGVILLTANTFQAIFVNKNDYNIEKKTAAPVKEQEKITDASQPEKEPVTKAKKADETKRPTEANRPGLNASPRPLPMK